MKECAVKKEGASLFAKITCEIDHHTAKVIRESIDRELLDKSVKDLTLDFSAVSFMDSSGIGLIIGRVMSAERVGARVEVRGLYGDLLRIVRMSGIEKIKGLSIK